MPPEPEIVADGYEPVVVRPEGSWVAPAADVASGGDPAGQDKTWGGDFAGGW